MTSIGGMLIFKLVEFAVEMHPRLKGFAEGVAADGKTDTQNEIAGCAVCLVERKRRSPLDIESKLR